MDKTPEEIKNEELVAKNAALEENIGKLSNVENTYKLKVEEVEREIATIEKTKKQKLGELSAVETDLKNALESAAKQKKSAIDGAVEVTEKVTALEAQKKTLENEIAEINAALIVATQAKTVTEESLAKAQEAHKTFMVHAESEKTRIKDELKQLDDAAKAQVVVIEAQSATQIALDAEISTKKGVVSQLDTDIETKTERVSTVTTELQNLEETHKNRMKATGEEFKTFMDETEAAKKKAAEELAIVEADLEAKNAKAVEWVGREEEMNQREQFLKERYKKAGIAW